MVYGIVSLLPSLSTIFWLIQCLSIVFTKCKESLKDGRRLENISWRLWYREMVASGYSPTSSPGSLSPLTPLSEKDMRSPSPMTPLSEDGSSDSNCKSSSHFCHPTHPFISSTLLYPALQQCISTRNHQIRVRFQPCLINLRLKRRDKRRHARGTEKRQPHRPSDQADV